MTGMGEIVQPADSAALASGVLKVLAARDHYLVPREQIMRIFDMQSTVMDYEKLFEQKRAA
jgi:hypothetical protein